MFAKTKIALAVAVVLGATFAASAATQTRVANNDQATSYDAIPGYAKDGSTVAIPNPDRSGNRS
jgi:hypothetical protein